MIGVDRMIRRVAENEYYIYVYYNMGFKTKKEALEKLIGYIYDSNFTSKSIKIDDGNSFHDGTNTKIVTQIDDMENFTRKYSGFKTVSFLAEYHGTPFALMLDLATLEFRLSCIKDYMVSLDEIEQQLNLLRMEEGETY